MSTDRKKKFKAKEEKDLRAREKKVASIFRVFQVMGIERCFADAPKSVFEPFLDLYGPPAVVAIDPSAEGDADIEAMRRELERVIKKVQREDVLGRPVELSIEDYFRGYPAVHLGMSMLPRALGSRRWNERGETLRVHLSKARDALRDFDEMWFHGAVGMLLGQLGAVASRSFRIDERVVDVRLDRPGGAKSPIRVTLALHIPKQSKVSYRGSAWSVFPCTTYFSVPRNEPLIWNCEELGIEGPRVRLPVYIEKHALRRLDERLPFTGHRSVLHKIAIDALEQPRGLHESRGGYLVDVEMGPHKVGYLVAHVLPQMILVKTFLTLTMQGTPECKLLREKLGLQRADVERYKLDDLKTLLATDMSRDPLLARVFSECGLGHLFSLFDPEDCTDWVSLHAADFKRRFAIQEATNGFQVGQKLMRWSPQPVQE